jgi:two-component system chemotaxis response regulator CheY
MFLVCTLALEGRLLVLIKESSPPPRQVLVVDDSETVRREIAQSLKHAGFMALEAGDGVSGLKLAQEQKPALIILDVNMPRMNGLEMLEHLRMDFATANIPVVILTTEAEELMIERARKAGAKGWLIKPVTADHVVRTAQAIANREPVPAMPARRS